MLHVLLIHFGFWGDSAAHVTFIQVSQLIFNLFPLVLDLSSTPFHDFSLAILSRCNLHAACDPINDTLLCQKEDLFVLSGALELQLLLQFLCHPIHFQLPFSSSHAITASDRSCQKINERYFLSRRIMKRRWNWFTSLLELFLIYHRFRHIHSDAPNGWLIVVLRYFNYYLCHHKLLNQSDFHSTMLCSRTLRSN